LLTVVYSEAEPAKPLMSAVQVCREHRNALVADGGSIVPSLAPLAARCLYRIEHFVEKKPHIVICRYADISGSGQYCTDAAPA
jgi:hypothetical protein